MSNQNFLQFQVQGMSLGVRSPARSMTKAKNSPARTQEQSLIDHSNSIPNKQLKSIMQAGESSTAKDKKRLGASKLPVITTSELHPSKLGITRKPRRNITSTQFPMKRLKEQSSPHFSNSSRRKIKREMDSTASNTNRFKSLATSNSKNRKDSNQLDVCSASSASISKGKTSPMTNSLLKIDSFKGRRQIEKQQSSSTQKDLLQVVPQRSSNFQRTRTFMQQQAEHNNAYPQYHKATTQKGKRKNSDSSNSAKRHEQFSGGNSSVSGTGAHLARPGKKDLLRKSQQQPHNHNMRNGSLESLGFSQQKVKITMNMTINNFDESKSFGSSKERDISKIVQQTSFSKRPTTIFEQQQKNQKQLLQQKLKIIQRDSQLKPSTRASKQGSLSGSRSRRNLQPPSSTSNISKVGMIQGKAISPMPKSQKQIQINKRHMKSSSKIMKGRGEVEEETQRFQLLDQRQNVSLRQDQNARLTATSGGFLSHMLHLDPQFVEKQAKIQKEKEEALRFERIRRELAEQEIIKRSLEQQQREKEYKQQQDQWKQEINQGFLKECLKVYTQYVKDKELKRIMEEEAKIRREVEEERKREEEEERKLQQQQQQPMLGMQLSAPPAKLGRQGSKRKLGNLKSIFNTTLALPVDPMKDKQNRLMGRLNKMMGEGGKADSFGKLEKKKSWEDIPILVAGANFLTPEERMRQEEKDLEEKLKREEEEKKKKEEEEEQELQAPSPRGKLKEGSIVEVVPEEEELEQE